MSMREAFHIPEEDLIQYALGTLKDTQMSQFTAHISLCNECRAQLANFQVELASFAAVQPLSELPSGARDRFIPLVSGRAKPRSVRITDLRVNRPLFLKPTYRLSTKVGTRRGAPPPGRARHSTAARKSFSSQRSADFQ